MNDNDLMTRAQAGEPQAVRALYDLHHQKIYRYVYARVSNVPLAEDLTGEVFTRMVAHLPDFQQQGVPLRAWLYRIAHNLIIDHYRQRDKRTLVALEHAQAISQPEQNPSAQLERSLEWERLGKALDTLTDAQREVVLLRFVVDLPLKEVALILKKTVAAVKSLQHRGLVALRQALEEEQGVKQ